MTKRMAKRALAKARMTYHGGHYLQVYRCSFCREFHLGNSYPRTERTVIDAEDQARAQEAAAVDEAEGADRS